MSQKNFSTALSENIPTTKGTGTDIQKGLTESEALKRLEDIGPNTVPETDVHPIRRILQKFHAPIPWMLEAAIVLELVLNKYAEAIIIAVLLLFNAVLGIVQEGRGRKTLAALKSQLALNASVLRNGIWKIVSSANVVPGDIVKLSLGAIVPADICLRAGAVLVDQSMLTGESVPIEAQAGIQTYAGALVRRGEAIGEVTQTGTRTKFGKTAELVRSAYVVSSQQKAVLTVVRNMAILNGLVIIMLIIYAWYLHTAINDMLSLGLTAVLGAIPVALPATFTLAAAIGARTLAKQGVLPTRLSAVDEAASIDILCSDKTGTLTQNQLKVTAVLPLGKFTEAGVLALAALSSSEGGQDPVDQAIRNAARGKSYHEALALVYFQPFDPATKMSEASVADAAGGQQKIVKGAFSAVSKFTKLSSAVIDALEKLQNKGYRVLAVAIGEAGTMTMAGLIALSDPPRADSAALVAELHNMGVYTVMITGDAPVTATAVAKEVGITGAVCPPGLLPVKLKASQYAVYAGVLPEDKYKLVKAFQASGHVVGMCGDGANDAPALRQAQMGIAVSTATDVAKSAAGIVLTTPGLNGIVSAIRVGRLAFQRVLSYTLNSITKKTVQTLFLVVGLLMTGKAILTPFLMVLLMITGDFLGMALTSDNVRPSPKPNVWRINRITFAGVFTGLGELLFCSLMIAWAFYKWKYNIGTLQTMAFILIVFGNQATCYINRSGRHWWSSRPGYWLLLSSVADLSIACTLAIHGWGMTVLPVSVIFKTLGAALLFMLLFDLIRAPLYPHLKIDQTA